MTDPDILAVEPAANSSAGFWNFGMVSRTRTLIFCAIGAFVGLGIAGYGLFTATGTTTAVFPAEDAAIVNGVPVLMVDLVGQVRALHDVPFARATRAQKLAALNDMVREELYVQRGVELGMPTDDIDVRSALVGAAEAQTASEALLTEPRQSDLIGYYNQHHDKYSSEGVMYLDDWIVPGRAEADAPKIVSALRAGTPPQSLGLVASGQLQDPEQFYFAARIHLGTGLFGVAQAMKDGAVSDAIRSGGQLHVLVMHRNRPPVPASFADVQARVLTDYMDLVKQRVLAENTRFLVGRAQIAIAPTLLQ